MPLSSYLAGSEEVVHQDSPVPVPGDIPALRPFGTVHAVVDEGWGPNYVGPAEAVCGVPVTVVSYLPWSLYRSRSGCDVCSTLSPEE